jgi:hypothetical protein
MIGKGGLYSGGSTTIADQRPVALKDGFKI